MKKYLCIISILIITVAGNSKTSTFSSEDEKPHGDIIVENEIEKLPCDLLTESDIKKTLSISEEEHAEIKNVVRTYPTCFYKWESISFSKTSIIGGNEVSIDYPTEVTIVVVKNASEEMYQTSTKVYKDGQAQQGIGDMAIWGGGMSQLTFLSKGYMIHLNVQMSNVEMINKENAIKLSALIIDKL